MKLALAAFAFAAFSCILFTGGCKDATWGQLKSMGSAHDVKLYSGGQLVGEWTSTGNVSNEEHSDGYYFMDAKTGKLVEVSGSVVITQN